MFKESGQTQDDCDVAIALFDPIRYKVSDVSGYNLNKLKDEDGNNYFRSLRLLKNTYEASDLRIGLGFFGQVGTMKELPKKKDITDDDYASIIDKSFFLENR